MSEMNLQKRVWDITGEWVWMDGQTKRPAWGDLFHRISWGRYEV